MIRHMITVCLVVGSYAAPPFSAIAQSVMAQADSSGHQPRAYGGLPHATGVRPSFEVATIRRSAANEEYGFTGITFHANGVEATDTSIQAVIEFAWDVPYDSEFSGGPSWIRTEKFDIRAKPSQAAILALSKLSMTDLRTQMRLMLQSLLEERLQLKVSFPVKNLPLFVLTVAKGGSSAGTKHPPAAANHPRHLFLRHPLTRWDDLRTPITGGHMRCIGSHPECPFQ